MLESDHWAAPDRSAKPLALLTKRPAGPAPVGSARR